MSHTKETPAWAEKSPWLDTSKTNLFRDEFQLTDEKLPGAYFTPLEPYRWIHEHNGKELFFRGLARFAPMFPLRAYQGHIALWTSPPPSGFGNAIYMVMGHDSKGELRLVGGNYFSEPSTQSVASAAPKNFFGKYDKANKYEKEWLVRETVARSISSSDIPLLLDIRRECEHFHTMGIYITVLTADGVLLHAAKAVIQGDRPADFSYENFGEIL
jgi:hypothetical protein